MSLAGDQGEIVASSAVCDHFVLVGTRALDAARRQCDRPWTMTPFDAASPLSFDGQEP
jgi:hypothetical protein